MDYTIAEGTRSLGLNTNNKCAPFDDTADMHTGMHVGYPYGTGGTPTYQHGHEMHHMVGHRGGYADVQHSAHSVHAAVVGQQPSPPLYTTAPQPPWAPLSSLPSMSHTGGMAPLSVPIPAVHQVIHTQRQQLHQSSRESQIPDARFGYQYFVGAPPRPDAADLPAPVGLQSQNGAPHTHVSVPAGGVPVSLGQMGPQSAYGLQSPLYSAVPDMSGQYMPHVSSQAYMGCEAMSSVAMGGEENMLMVSPSSSSRDGVYCSPGGCDAAGSGQGDGDGAAVYRLVDGDHTPGRRHGLDSSNSEQVVPLANIFRIMKLSLPSGAKISRPAADLMRVSISEFIQFVTSEAADSCLEESSKSITAESILSALDALDFGTFVTPLRELIRQRQYDSVTGGMPVGTNTPAARRRTDWHEN